MCVEPDIHKKRIEKRIAMRTGELPLELIRMKAKGCTVELSENEPGFTLPSNIGELGDDITELDLSYCSLHGHGAFVVRGTMTRHTLTKMKLCSRRSRAQGRCRR